MVIEWLSNVFSGLIQWLIESVPAPAPPAWFNDAEGFITGVGDFIGWFDPWAPVPLALSIMALWVITFALGLGLKLARMVISYMTFGGGAT